MVRMDTVIPWAATVMTTMATATTFCYAISTNSVFSSIFALLITLTESSRKRNVTVRPSVCHVGMLTVIHQGGAGCDAASVHFVPTIGRTEILVNSTNHNIYILYCVCIIT